MLHWSSSSMYRWRAVSPFRTFFHFLVCSPFPFLLFVNFFLFLIRFCSPSPFFYLFIFPFRIRLCSPIYSFRLHFSSLFVCAFRFSVFSSVSALRFSFLCLSYLCSPSSFSCPCVLYSFVSVPISPFPTYINSSPISSFQHIQTLPPLNPKSWTDSVKPSFARHCILLLASLLSFPRYPRGSTSARVGGRAQGSVRAGRGGTRVWVPLCLTPDCPASRFSGTMTLTPPPPSPSGSSDVTPSGQVVLWRSWWGCHAYQLVSLRPLMRV